MSSAQSQTPGQILRDVECYSANLSEFAKEIREKLIDPETDRFLKVDLDFTVTVIQSAYNKMQESLTECEGSPLVITLPEGPAGVLIGLLLSVLGIKL